MYPRGKLRARWRQKLTPTQIRHPKPPGSSKPKSKPIEEEPSMEPARCAASAPVAYAMGVNYAGLPPGASPANVAGVTYYISGNTWFKPMYGANGVYYRVVPTP